MEKKSKTPNKAVKKLNKKDLKAVKGGAAADTFLKLDGIKGESADDKHKDEIHIS